MKKYYLLFLLVLMITGLTFQAVAQTPSEAAATPTHVATDVISIFSDAYTDVASTNFNPWGNADYTAETVAGNATIKYANFYDKAIEFASAQDVSGMTHIHVDVWSTETTIGTKLINSTWVEDSHSEAVTASTWTSLEISLSEYTPSMTINDLKFIVFEGGSGGTVFIDNIYFYISADPIPTMAAPTPISRLAVEVISIFSDAYTDVASTNFNPWGNADYTAETVEGNATIKYANFYDKAIEFASAEDVSGMTHIHVDVWSTGTTIGTKFINSTWVEKSQSRGFTSSTWTSLDIPLSEYTPSMTINDLKFIVFEGGSGETVFIDNIYFYVPETLTISTSETTTGHVSCGNLVVATSQTYTVASGHTLTVLGDMTIDGDLVINSGGSLITYDGNTTGQVTIKRNTRYSDGKYSFVGSPVEANASITGADLGSIVYSYDETIAYGADGLARWEDASSEEIVPGKGYAQANQKEISFTGIPNDGTITVTGLSHTSPDGNHDEHGWSLLSNPYPAAIDLGKFLSNTANSALLDGAAYLWDDNGSNTERGSNSDYLTVNSLGDVGGPNGGLFNGYLGSMQGFFVKIAATTASASVEFTEYMRVGGVNDDGNFFRKGVDNSPRIKLVLESKDQAFYNELMIGLRADATMGVDKHYDATKLITDSGLEFYSLIEDNKFAIQGLPFESGVSSELAFNIIEASDLTLSVKELISTSGSTFYLYDKVTGMTHDLNMTGDITFSASEGTDQNRFVLTYSIINVLDIERSSNDPIYRFANNELNVRFNTNTPVVGYTVYDLSGQALFSKSLNSSLNELNIPMKNKGINIIKIVTTEASYTRKFLF